ncbi:hypothetical protein [Methylophaga sp. OBS4]|nr:hypothetical protein [Methylophaga sp. OBS4]MCX4186775.1 hypothetical protein [Methylophaga sp. OBS4]
MAIGNFMAAFVNRHRPADQDVKYPWDVMPYLKEPEWTLEQLQEMWD